MEEAIQGKRVVLVHIHQGRMYPQEKCLVQPLQWWAESAPPPWPTRVARLTES